MHCFCCGILSEKPSNTFQCLEIDLQCNFNDKVPSDIEYIFEYIYILCNLDSSHKTCFTETTLALQNMLVLFKYFWAFWSLIGHVHGQILPCSAGQSSEICFIGENYSSVERPPNLPVKVRTNFKIGNVVNINEEEQTLTIFLTLDINWDDLRLFVNRTDVDEKE